MRAWVLGYGIEARAGGPLRESALVPAWACQLLMGLSDPLLPWSEDETERLLKVGTLSEENRELVVLWITAALLEGLTNKPLLAVQAFSPHYFQVAAHSLAQDCVEHVLMPIHRIGEAREARPGPAAEVLRQLNDLIDPANNHYQTEEALRFWDRLIGADGIMGLRLGALQRSAADVPTGSLADHVKSMADWQRIDASSRRAILNRVAEFSRLIEMARTALATPQEGLREEPLAISRQAIAAILERIGREAGNGWWLAAIASGLATL